MEGEGSSGPVFVSSDLNLSEIVCFHRCAHYALCNLLFFFKETKIAAINEHTFDKH